LNFKLKTAVAFLLAAIAIARVGLKDVFGLKHDRIKRFKLVGSFTYLAEEHNSSTGSDRCFGVFGVSAAGSTLFGCKRN